MAAIFSSFPLLRTAAPRLTREFFTCTGPKTRIPGFVSRRSLSTHARLRPSSLAGRSNFRRSQSTIASIRGLDVGNVFQSISEGASRSIGKAFPEVSDRVVGYWLLGSAASVFGIVVFGGLTRLTESGLSITEWRPVTGSLPPMSNDDWMSEFDKYRTSPEFQQLNPNMSLSEFKQIYWMEWGHRLWGRVVGITFLLPTIYFIARKQVSKPMAGRLLAICGGIGFQGFLGWWMVKSGLRDDLFAEGSHPRVSQYRLTAHLGAAFLVYVGMLTSGLSILREHRLLKDPQKSLLNLTQLQSPALRFFRGSVAALCGLVFVTAMSGALVAGLDAGLIYNEFPYMGVGLTPPKKELFDPFYSHTADQSDLWWRNMLENPSLVQLDHRIMATTTFTAVMSLFAYTRLAGSLRHSLRKDVRTGVTRLVQLVGLQVALGISTLIYLVPTWLASAHQAGALLLLTGAVALRSRIITPARTVQMLKDIVEQKRLAELAKAQAKARAEAQGLGPDKELLIRKVLERNRNLFA